MTELAAWLGLHALGQYARVMAENDVDLATLPHLTDEDLKLLGLSLGHRRKLLAALRDGAPAATAPPGTAAERRQLTVMFCDLAGSTELAGRLDPEVLREVLGRYHDAVTGAVVAQEGHVAKLLGDGVLAYFGWPAAHEDDAERAVRAALAAVALAGAMEAAGAPLAARVGIATGAVVVGDRAGAAEEQGAVAGATPSLAARLQGAAKPGEVVISGTTRRLVGGTFDLEDRGAARLKGFAEPVLHWRVRGPAQPASRFEARHGTGLTEFVGRAHELDLLADRWRRAAAGEGQIVMLSGEAGIGKSRILREFAASLHPDACRVLRYQCSPHEVNAAFQPLIAEIEAAAGFRPEDDADARLDRLERHIAEVFAEPGTASALIAGLLGMPLGRYPPLDMAPQRRKQQTVAVLAERVARIAGAQQLVLLFEDIHWIDPSSLETLDALVARFAELPALAVVTHRPEFAARWTEYGHVTAHSTNRLSREGGHAIAERVAGGKALPEEVLERILARTDGVPLFVEELTKTVLEAGILEEREGRYVLNGPLPALAIPETLQDSLMARLDRLAPVKRVVQAAACIGREFEARLLAAALRSSAAEIDAALNQLMSAGLVFRQGTGERYAFKHALVQDAAYASLLNQARRSIHERLALVMEASGEPDPLELARHHAGAGAHQRAASLFLAAGLQSLKVSALPEAIGALELGLASVGEMAPSTERDRLELDIRVGLGTARMAKSGWAHPTVSAALEPAFPLACAFGDADALASILWGLWVHFQTRTDFPRAHEWLDELEKLAAENGASDLPLVYDMSAGCQWFWEADYRRALRHTDRLRKRYDRGHHSRITALTNHDPLVFSQHWAGSLADWIAGRPDRSLERMDEAIDVARRIGHPFNLVFALTAGATSLIYLDMADRMLACCNEAEKVVADEALGPFSENVNVRQWRGGAHIVRGDFETGHRLLRQGNNFWTASGGRICTAMFRGWIVLGLKGLGKLAEAAALGAANTAHCRETGDRYMEPECLRLQGELAREADSAAAGRYLQDALAKAREHRAKSWELRAAMSLARHLQAQDRPAEAIACLEPVYTWFTEGMETADLQQARALLSSLS